MINLKRPLVFVDLETTGTNVATDRILEISCVKVMDGKDNEVKTLRLNPTIPIPEGATKIHGISDDDVKDSPTFKQVSKGIMDFITDCDLAGFRSNGFDFPMLFHEFSRAGIDWDYSKHNLIDVGNIFQIKEPRTLAAAYKFYCDKELEGAHGAEADISATIEVLWKQIEKYELPEDVEELNKISNYGLDRLDLSGFFGYGEDGSTIVFNKGNHKGQSAKNHYWYLHWIKNEQSMASDTKRVAEKIMSEFTSVPPPTYGR